jgi:nucleoside-diphosphate kinase
MEKTLVLLKPDAVQRGLVGEIISRFEKAGLEIVAAKVVRPDQDLANQHYPIDREEFITGMGHKTLSSYQEEGHDPLTTFGSEDAHEVGLQLQKWLVDFITSGPVLAIVLQGPNAVNKVRELRGHTIPTKAEKGTISGDYSDDSPVKANTEKRAIKNLVHASGDATEAAFEINLWFEPSELIS